MLETLLLLVVVLIVVALVFWALQQVLTVLPIDRTLRVLIQVVVVLIIVVFLLNWMGLISLR